LQTGDLSTTSKPGGCAIKTVSSSALITNFNKRRSDKM